MKFFIVRHGESEANRLGVYSDGSHRLTEKGRADAGWIADLLSRAKVEAVYSSPIVRAKETAQIIAKPHRLRVKVVKGLVESGAKPELLGRKVPRNAPTVLTNPSAYTETFEEITVRMIHAFRKIERLGGENVVVVSHGDPISALLYWIVERSVGDARYHTMYSRTGSLSVVETVNGMPRLTLFNLHKDGIG